MSYNQEKKNQARPDKIVSRQGKPSRERKEARQAKRQF